jgi:hypothetical protein
MNKKFFKIAAFILIPFSLLNAQVDEQLRKDVRLTGYVHNPLPIDYGKAYETWSINKKVLLSDLLCDMETADRWTHKGIGSMSVTSDRSIDGKNSLRIDAPTKVDKFLDWGLGFGTSLVSFDAGGKSWEKYNRIHFYIYPDCEGARTVYLNLYVVNDGKIKVPDKYGREGYHEINLINHQWNECFIEMTELARDKVTALQFAIEMFGREETMGEKLQFDVDRVELQTVENPEVVSGWKPAANRIIFSTTGYSPDGEKSALTSVTNHGGKFQLLDYNTSQVVYEGLVKNETTRLGAFQTMDFSAFTREGRYMLKVGDVYSQPFYVNERVWEDSAWRVLNFMFCERCGYPVPGKHASCHTDLNGEHKGHLFTVNGGWHDAGDMSQQTYQTAEIAYSFFEVAQKAKARGNIDLYNRAMEEGLWGLDFVLKTRLGEGYRMQTWGTNLWTDGLIGTIDDQGRRQFLVNNSGYENFGYSGIEAYVSTLIENDPEMKAHLVKIAKEDFGYALERFEKLGYGERIRGGGGHAYMTSQSQYMATIAWAAGMIYKVTHDPFYAGKAAEAIRYTLACQRTEALNDKDRIRGFFYRDLDKKSIVHFNHQSRDQIFMMALTLLCETQPHHPDYTKWENAIRLYGGYLKAIFRYVQPYGMIPSGVYHIDEVKDSANFYVSHVWIEEDVTQDYIEQLNNSFKLDEGHYLRIFPVWFSFKGNIAVHLATGKAAALCGKFLKDKALLNIAEQQLMWVVGKNPFGQSLIYGEGSNYGQLYNALPGEMVGEIPVGMQSRFNEDTPYWPQFNTATYKEVWGSSAARWLTLVAEF